MKRIYGILVLMLISVSTCSCDIIRKAVSIRTVEPAPVLPNERGQKVVSFAKTKIGSRYKFSASGPNAFDCSGFTSFVFSHFGISLPRVSADQYKVGHKILKGEQLRPGDLVFWSNTPGSQNVGHVGIVVEYHGGGKFTFIHASTSQGVRLDESTGEWYARRYVGARRVL